MKKLYLKRNELCSIAVLLMTLFVTISAQNSHAQTPLVGSLGGEIVVSPMGTASYSIPIDVVPGTNGMQPSLAITYNSVSGRGMMGMGWTLSGLSCIARTQQNHYYDGVIGSVNFDGNDRFTLDGERLVTMSNGNYISQNMQYGTEIENFVRVTLKGNPNNPDSIYFIAVNDQGQRIEYGHTTYSKCKLAQGGILYWMANKVTDAEGNYMTIDFERTSDYEIRPYQIVCTKNDAANLTGYATVRFIYSTDPNANKTYIGGNTVITKSLLSKIIVKYGSDVVRQYELEYDYDRTTRLTAVVLQDSSGIELTRTSIKYRNDLSYENYTTISGFDGYEKQILDYNGDNIQDLLLTCDNQGGCQWMVYQGKSDGSYSSTNHFGNIATPSQLFVVDFDGDGRDGFGYVYQSNPNSFIFKVEETITSSFQEVFSCSKQSGDFRLGDFLGEGGVQFLFIANPSSQNRLVTNSINSSSFSVPENSLISVTDLNGNGKADIQVSYGNHLDVYEYDEELGRFEKILDNHWLHHVSTQEYHGDFNGDGMKDMIQFSCSDGVGHWYLKISKGNDYTNPEELPFNTAHGNGVVPTYPLLISDINGDGKDDIVQASKVLNSLLFFHIYYVRGYTANGLQYSSSAVYPNGITGFTNEYFQFADINNDGKNELVYVGATQQDPVTVSFPERRDHDLVSSITNGLGATTSLEYRYYHSPMINYLGLDGKRVHYPLVSKVRRPNGIGGLNVTTHTYGEAIFDYERQLLLGFRISNTYCNEVNVKQKYLYNSQYHHLGPDQSLTYNATRSEDEPGGYNPDSTYWAPDSQDFYYLETLYTPDYMSLPNGRFLPYSSSTTVYDRLKNMAKTDACLLNSQGRVYCTTSTHKKAKAENAYYPWISCDSTEIQYVNVSLPNGETAVKTSRVKTWNIRNGFSQKPFHQASYYYATGRLDSITTKDSDGSIGKTCYTYNAFGLPVSETYIPQSMASRTKTISYDSKGRFVTQETDVLNHHHGASYNNYTGLMTEETDANNLKTQYQYDALGRVTRIIRPDLTVRDINYHWNDVNDFEKAIYYIKETESGTPETRTYYDCLGRAIHTYCEGQGYHDIVYDAKGRMVTKTFIPYEDPSATASSKTWHDYDYDTYDRVVEESCPYADYSYSFYDPTEASQHDYFISVDDNIRNTRQIKTFDALGRVTKAQDQGGTINYSYAYETVSGKIRDKMTVSVGNAVTTVISDIRGNRLSISDPDAGTVTSVYNVLNQLTSQTDANGCQTSFNYDLAGRTVRKIVSKNNQDELIIYDYDNAPGKGVGKLASVYHNDDVDLTYAYDTLGRLCNEQVHDGNTTYDHLYQYDTLGRLEYLTYPDGFRIKQTYNPYGELSTIYDAGTNHSIYSIKTRNAFRQPLIALNANGTGTKYTYNDYGQITGIKNGNTSEQQIVVQSGEPGETPIILYDIGSQYRNLTYHYNSRGFIDYKTDSNVNQTESYTYDPLDRLTSYRVNGVVEASYTYNGNGNITTHSKVGSYSYSSTKPHAVSSIEGNAVCPIPASLCDVTYNLRNRPATLTENGYNIDIDYDASGMRRHTEITNGNTLVKSKTKISSLYELETTPSTSRRLDYIYAEGRIVAIHVDENSTGSLYYVLTDHLGSWEKVLDEDKNTVQQTHFDPWGNRMSYTAWNTPQTQTSFTFDRGFTGHEHYDCMHIINANARLYDPVIGRFFSPDPFVQAPDFTQGFNRYSYCLNNPVMYSDPDGESILAISMIVGAVVCAYIGGTATNGWNYNPCSWSWDGKTWAGIGLGAVAGAAAGFAFAYAAPALASTAFMSHFGVSGVMTSYTLSGFASLGASGYAAGFGGGMLYSNGDTYYSHLSGVQGFKVGATVGALAGQLTGDIVSYNPPRQSYSMTIEPENKWKGNYFQGTEEEARQSLVETSMLFKTETAMWCTSRGYYFEPISGDPAYTYNYRTYCCDDNGMTYRMLHELNVNIGYRSNTINTSNTFSKLDLINNDLYLYPTNGPVSKVYYHAHTHPHNSEPSDADNNFSYFLGIPCRIYGWNGCVYYFGGPGYWH